MRQAVDRCGVALDIALWEPLQACKTQLLNEYLRLDPRVRLLFRAVKHWGKARGIVDAQRGYFNSFALTLMMLFSLQHKGVLPVLQRRAAVASCTKELEKAHHPLPELGAPRRCCDPRLQKYFDSSLQEQMYFNTSHPARRALSPSPASEAAEAWEAGTGELLLHFFSLLVPGNDQFNVRTQCLSVRRGEFTNRRDYANFDQSARLKRNWLHVEDPFNPLDNPARNVQHIFHIQREFVRARDLLLQGASFAVLCEKPKK